MDLVVDDPMGRSFSGKAGDDVLHLTRAGWPQVAVTVRSGRLAGPVVPLAGAFTTSATWLDPLIRPRPGKEGLDRPPNDTSQS